jgi:poly(3-hydroxybutyrate) depolymerase
MSRPGAPLLAAFLAVALVATPAPAQQPQPTPDTTETRLPWEPPGEPFIRDWLLLGQFPAPVAFEDDEAPDFLLEHGGERAITPVAGMAHTGPDGERRVWIAHQSTSDLVDVAAALGAEPQSASVSYAFTTIDSAEAGPALLAMGIDGGVVLYVNGERVFTNLRGRVAVPDEDLAKVMLVKGPNRILVKMQNVWGNVALCARRVGPAKLLERAAALRVQQAPEGASLTVQIDDPLAQKAAWRPQARLELVAAGGKMLAARTALRGAAVVFDVAALEPGPYEVRCASARLDGQPTLSYAGYYKGDMLAAARHLVAEAAAARPDDLITPVLGQIVQHRLRGKVNEVTRIPDAAFAGIHSALMEGAELHLAETDPSARARGNGFVRLAWIDPVDGSPQYCRAYLPLDYDTSRRWPMAVNLHGFYGANPPYVGWWSADSRHSRIADDHGVILIEPHGRGNVAYQGIGRLDVLRAIDEAKAAFSVDPDRVLLVGQSMGGYGTWHVGTRHPELFAAIGPIYGGSDYRVQFNPELVARVSPFLRFLLEASSSLAQAEDLLTTPVYAHHGDADTAVPVINSRYNVKTLQRWGYDIRYAEYPGKGHGGLEAEYETTRWFLPLRRAHPKHVRLRAAELKFAHAHWLAVTQRQAPMKLVLGEARICGPNWIRLDTDNALEVVLTPGDLIDPARPVSVVWNRAPEREVDVKDGRIVVRADGYAPEGVVKTPKLEGPLSDVTTTPYAIVVGTVSDDSEMRKACRADADRRIAEWEDAQHVTPRHFLDTELSDADMARYSLVLIGGPEANAVTRRLIHRLPLKIEKDRVTIDGRTFDAPGAAVGLVYPHPLNPERYVAVYAATAPSAQAWHVSPRGPDLRPALDFYIDDGRTGDVTQGVAIDRLFVAAGLFDWRWRRAEASTLLGDPALRAAAPLRRDD